MGKIKEMIKESQVHERRMELRTYPAEDNKVIVEGWLRDERFEEGYHWNGQRRPPGVVHWMCVRMLVGDWPIKILDAEAEMPGVPHELCVETMESLQKIIGLPIVSGYSDEVRKRLGGVNGCTHMTHLIVTMGPAALHGFWAQQSRKPMPVPKSFDEIAALPYLLNSCQLWAEDGPFVKMMKEEIDKKPKEE